MKIVQINSVCGFGSTGTIMVNISRQLNERGIENYMFYGVGQSKVKNAVRLGNYMSLRSHQIFSMVVGKHGFYSKKATEKLIVTLKRIRPDIVHLHNIHGFYINLPLLFGFLKEFNLKVVWTLHDCWSFTGHCAHFMFEGCEKWKVQCDKCPSKMSYPRSLFFDTSKKCIRKKRIYLLL